MTERERWQAVEEAGRELLLSLDETGVVVVGETVAKRLHAALALSAETYRESQARIFGGSTKGVCAVCGMYGWQYKERGFVACTPDKCAAPPSPSPPEEKP